MLNQDPDSKKRKFGTTSRQPDDPGFLQANLSMPSCLAGAPRGLYNLGQSCYMSVILQAMIHNPLMRNYFLAGRHNSTECNRSPCLACALNDSFADILATDKIEGHGPVSLLHKSWLCHPVRFSLVYASSFVTAAPANTFYPGPCRLPSTRRTRVFPVHAGSAPPDERLRRGKGLPILRMSLPPELLRKISQHRHLPRLQERDHGRRPLHRPEPRPAPPSKAKKNRRRGTEQRGSIRADRLSAELHQLREATSGRLHVQIGEMPKQSPASDQARDNQETPSIPLYPAKSEQPQPNPPSTTPNPPIPHHSANPTPPSASPTPKPTPPNSRPNSPTPSNSTCPPTPPPPPPTASELPTQTHPPPPPPPRPPRSPPARRAGTTSRA